MAYCHCRDTPQALNGDGRCPARTRRTLTARGPAREHRQFEREQWGGSASTLRARSSSGIGSRSSARASASSGLNGTNGDSWSASSGGFRTACGRSRTGSFPNRTCSPASQVALQTQIHAAQEEGNQIALASLQMQKQQLDLQIMQLEGQKQQFEQAAEHQARVDMQSFAQWRQTPDGRAFMQWATAADGWSRQSGTVTSNGSRRGTNGSERVSDAEVTAHRALTELPEQISAELSRSVLKFKLPTLKRYVWWIIGIAVVSAIVASVGTILIPVVLGALAYYVWATKRRNARLSELRKT